MQRRDYSEIPEADKVSIWKKISQRGSEYISGFVTIDGKEYKLVAFANKFKSENEKRPDYISIEKK